jgi:penicillin-binding protein 1A
MGITYLKKTCSMALGDTGMTPLDHTGGYATFASGGLYTRPYAIEELHTLQGKLLYSHDRDEKPREQIFDRKAVETLNTMLQGVVLNGTGKAAQLDYTWTAGKTGTSSNYRDAWFIGFTGEYVVGVWLGNDDFTPMARVTGGSFPAQTWHDFMLQAHDTDNIPTIPGLEPHPVQVAEQQRLAALQKAAAAEAGADAAAAPVAPAIPAPSPESVKDMSGTTRQILERIGDLLKQAPIPAPSDTKPENRAEGGAARPAASGSNVAAATPPAAPAEVPPQTGALPAAPAVSPSPAVP